MMQLNFLEFIDGNRLAETGLQMAVDHANDKEPGWSEKVWKSFIEWVQSKPSGYLFMIEDFRRNVEGKIETPPSKRAFGFISKRAVKEGLIKFNCIKKVNNHKAHGANANQWRVC